MARHAFVPGQLVQSVVALLNISFPRARRPALLLCPVRCRSSLDRARRSQCTSPTRADGSSTPATSRLGCPAILGASIAPHRTITASGTWNQRSAGAAGTQQPPGTYTLTVGGRLRVPVRLARPAVRPRTRPGPRPRRHLPPRADAATTARTAGSELNVDEVGDTESQRACRLKECSITSRHDEVVVVHRFGRREVDGVIAAEAQTFGQCPSAANKLGRHFHHIQLIHEILKAVHCVTERRVIETIKALGLGERRASFGVNQTRRHDSVGLIPQARTISAGLLFDHDRHQGRRIEVDNQRRWSATRSLTLPLDRTRRLGRLRVGFGAGVTSPSATRRSKARPPAMGTMRATADPRSVTTTSSPSRTRSR